MLVFTIYDVLYSAINIIESGLTLLFCIVDQSLILCDGLLLVTLGSQFIMADSDLLKALFSWLTTKQLQRCLSAWSIRGKNPLWPLLGQIIGYNVFVEFVARNTD